MAEKSPKRKITIEVSKELHLRAKVKAAQTGKPMAEVVREALEAWIEGNCNTQGEK